MPRLNGSRRTHAPIDLATAAVRSTEPSSTTTTSRPGSNARSSSMTAGSAPASFSAGTIATRRRSERASSGDPVTAVSGTGPRVLPETDQIEEAPRSVRIRVPVEHALTRPPAELLRLPRIGQQLSVDLHRLVRTGDDAQLAL